MRPAQIPRSRVFDSFDRNHTVSLPMPQGAQGPPIEMQVAEGSIKQGDGWVSQLAVLPAVVKPQEVLGMMLLLTAPQHTVTFDSDPDTVDGM